MQSKKEVKMTKVVKQPQCVQLRWEEPACPEYMKMNSQWMKDRNHRRCTFLLNASDLDPDLANHNFYLAKSGGELEIFCIDCFWSSTDLSPARAWNRDFKRVHSCGCPLTRGRIIRPMDNYDYEVNRLNSLLPRKKEFRPIQYNPGFCFDLAKSGFYYKGPCDLVACQYCKMELNAWENEDSAKGEHLRLAVDEREGHEGQCICPLLTDKMYDGSINIKIGENLEPSVADSVRIRDTVSEVLLPTFEKYKDEIDRLVTFSQWRYENSINPAVLAKNFLICVGDERLMCCKCNFAFKVLSPDANPLDFHFELSPNCGN